MTSQPRAGAARSLVAVAVAAVAILAAAGAAVADSPSPGPSGAPTSSAGPASSGGPAGSGGSAISIIQKTFQPADLTIHVGDTVTWTVTEAISDPHTVTSGLHTDAKPGTIFDSGIGFRKNGDSYSHTFAAAGTFPYFCAVHPDTMHGTITVTAADGSGSEAGGDSGSSKLITAAVLGVAIVLLFGWARVYRRMNPA